MYEEVTAAGLAVNVLVNNAGFGVYGLFAQADLEAELQMRVVRRSQERISQS
jgi:short-subunit dehydrogenase